MLAWPLSRWPVNRCDHDESASIVTVRSYQPPALTCGSMLCWVVLRAGTWNWTRRDVPYRLVVTVKFTAAEAPFTRLSTNFGWKPEWSYSASTVTFAPALAASPVNRRRNRFGPMTV